MRFNLTFKKTGKYKMLPMDYQYYISAWIYKVLKQADADFADFLHKKGYGTSINKLYKLFTFSRLNFGKPILHKERKLFEINNQNIYLKVAFDVNDIASNFMKGLFKQQELYLGDKFNGIELMVTSVETLSEPEFKPLMKYKLHSPWVVSVKNENDKYATYLSPNNPNFKSLAIKHISEKYESTHNKKAKEIILNITTESKRAGFLIKPGTKEESRIIGNLFEFELNAQIKIHQMIWNAGISEKSAIGFGWIEVA